MLEVIRDMGLAVASFDRANEPEGVSTMEWGTRTAIDNYRKLHNRVPDVVYDLGAVGKEPMIRVLAHRAVDIGRRLGEEEDMMIEVRPEGEYLYRLCSDIRR